MKTKSENYIILKKIEENLCDLKVGKDFLVETQKAQIIKLTVGKLDFT